MKLNLKHVRKVNLRQLKTWLKFVTGLLALSLFYSFFVSGYIFPGVFGEVLRHNQRNNIDAPALFYTVVENMSELENGLSNMRLRAAEEYTDENRQKSDSLLFNEEIVVPKTDLGP